MTRPRLADFVIIGAMKCGTSSLHERLSEHPSIFMSEPKEPNFFSDDAIFARGVAWYASLFEKAGRGQLCGESSTHYTKLPSYPFCAERLHHWLPEARLIYVMRHPVDRIVSQYVHEWTQREIVGSLSEALKRHERLVAYSCYARQLEPWIDRFGFSRILPVFLERLVVEPRIELARITEFLGAPEHLALGASPLEERNVSRDRLRRTRLLAALRWIPGLAAVKRSLPDQLASRMKSFWQMRSRPELLPAQRAEIEAILDQDLARLGEWLGTPLSTGSWRERVLGPPLHWAAGAQRP